jgi:hypothetical protein
MKTLLSRLVAPVLVGLVGCAGADDPSPSSVPASSPDAGGQASPSADFVAPACPPAKAEEEQLTPSPIVKCVGQYEGWGKQDGFNEGSIGTGWLHRTAEGCLWNRSTLLRADGRIRYGAEAATGTWTGDELYFTAVLDDGHTLRFARTEAQPSK